MNNKPKLFLILTLLLLFGGRVLAQVNIAQIDFLIIKNCNAQIKLNTQDYKRHLFLKKWKLIGSLNEQCVLDSVESLEDHNLISIFQLENKQITFFSLSDTLKGAKRKLCLPTEDNYSTFEIHLKNEIMGESTIRFKVLKIMNNYMILELWRGERQADNKIRYTKVTKLLYCSRPSN